TSLESLRLQVGGMTCAACAARVEKVVRRLPGVVSADVSFATEDARVAFAPTERSLDDVIAAVERAGFTAAPVSRDRRAREARLEEQERAEKRERLVVALAFALTAPLVFPMVGMLFGEHWML